jgi:hypothetical protein
MARRSKGVDVHANGPEIKEIPIGAIDWETTQIRVETDDSVVEEYAY